MFAFSHTMLQIFDIYVMYKCQYIYTYIKNGNWIILGQIKRKSQNVSKVRFFEFSTQDSSPKSLKHQLVAFYVLNNNFFYSQVVFANIIFFQQNLLHQNLLHENLLHENLLHQNLHHQNFSSSEFFQEFPHENFFVRIIFRRIRRNFYVLDNIVWYLFFFNNLFTLF